MRALINDKTNDTITEDRWLDWFGPNGEALTVDYMGYRLANGHMEQTEDGPKFIEDPQGA